jgi:mannose-6-phosphate isomerase-like protein (cupin superfamily)
LIKTSKSYDNRIILKPWGEEYNIFRNRKKLAITYLKIDKGKSTSLHCHPKKKTGFLILSGTAEVQVGIYKSNKFICKPMSILVLRPGLFHKIQASKKNTLYALEVETPYLKKDLIRMEDDYGRKSVGYENLKSSKNLTKKNIVFKIPKLNKTHKYTLHNIIITIAHHSSIKIKTSQKKNIVIILDGLVVNNKSKTVIKEGEIIKLNTLVTLCKTFKIKKRLLLLIAKK